MVLFDTLRTHAMKEEVIFHFEKVVYSKLSTSWRYRRCNWLFRKPTGFQKGLLRPKKGNKIGFPSHFFHDNKIKIDKYYGELTFQLQFLTEFLYHG